MSPFGVFLLALAAFIGTVSIFVSPLDRFKKWAKGRKKSELQKEINDKMEEADDGELLGKLLVWGAGCCIYFLLGVIYSFIIEPLVVIFAITNKIGYQPVAFVMLGIVALSWILIIRTFLTSKETETKVTVETGTGEQIKGILVDHDEIDFGNPIWNGLNRIFFNLPTLYMWYLFLVGLGVLQ